MVNTNPQIAIITDDPGWHGQQLKSALNNHGFDSVYISLTQCHWSLNQDVNPVNMPGFKHLPLGIFIRGVPGGSLEQVIFRLDILHALESLGVVIYNTPRSIEKTVDKAMTSFLLQQAGLPGPKTWISESIDHARKICMHEFNNNGKIVLKPLFGSQGIGIQLMDKNTHLINTDQLNGLYYLQSFVKRKSSDWSDFRVFVINGTAVAAMVRRSDSWITNRAQGAKCEFIKIDKQLRDLAEAAVKALDIYYAGVDLILDENDRFQIIEVNSIPAWWGLQKVTDFNIAAKLIEHFISRISALTPLTVIP